MHYCFQGFVIIIKCLTIILMPYYIAVSFVIPVSAFDNIVHCISFYSEACLVLLVTTFSSVFVVFDYIVMDRISIKCNTCSIIMHTVIYPTSTSWDRVVIVIS